MRVIFILFWRGCRKSLLLRWTATHRKKPRKEAAWQFLRLRHSRKKELTQEQIDYIMAEAGKQVNSLTAERDGYKNQLATAQASLKAMEGIDAAGLQTKINELSEQMKGKDAEIEKIKSDYAFDAAVKEAIRKASGKNERAIMALLDVDGLKASKNQTQDIDAALAAVKKDNDYLFGVLRRFREW